MIMVQTSLVVPSNSPADHSPYSQSQSCSGSSSPSLVPRHMAAPDLQVTSSSALPIDELLSDSEMIKPNSNLKSGQSSRKLDLSSTSKNNPIPSQNIYQPSTTHWHFHPALVLQNKGSVARDHLASERTFLAYVRTSLGMASAGVALVQLFTMADLLSKSSGVPLPSVNQKLQRFATPLGLTVLGMSLIVLIIGAYRYFLIQHSLPEDKFPAARLPIVFISFGFGAITAIVFGALLSGKVLHT